MRRHEFLVSLIKIAAYKYIMVPKQKLASLKKKGHEVSISKASTPSATEALEMLCSEFIMPAIEKHSGSSIRTLLGSDEVLLILHDNLDRLSSAFNHYTVNTAIDCISTESGKGISPRQSRMMDLKGFSSFANDAAFLGGSAEFQDELNVKAVRQIFSASQHDTTSNSDEMQLAESHQQYMVFAEFLEAILRLGVAKWTDEDKSALVLIERAVKLACSIRSKTRET
mmetsp:Transcript_52773/g.78221  ORF Transcript_52773/g.78221 Transcript_52773/m.78221 type:complete len:226 (+) Transcript_52773:1373-2050(+)|eukprot:CAMPEP_0195540204 /NCGR_PEP_ID=MMETSP0794_2-20130614/50446_1 /TAXON_ID=515487 /ORGANISM="Stephanopyxis turris, Strain CCMP 815" /LENGTH=225 /DNA_ID=CAMNT_0040674269 /DNA_START=1367 /DNA_END=2044 /DNA_ORIENTATION=+